MIPATYPSQIDSDNRTQAVIYYLTSITGLERWKDYIPVRESSLASPELNSFNTNGSILTTTLTSVSGKQAWVDYIPVYRDDLATDAWSVSATGYLATKDINSLQALAIIASYGADAHLYLPGVGVINGYTAGNYLDSAGTTPITVDNPVGLVVDSGGINAIQATTANKPILRRGLVNLALQSKSFTNSPWIFANATFTDGGIKASDTTSVEHLLNQGSIPGKNTVHTMVAKVKKGAVDFVSILLFDQAFNGIRRYFNLNLGTVSSAENPGTGTDAATPQIVNAGNGFYYVFVYRSANAGTTLLTARISSASADLTRIYSAANTTDVQTFVQEVGVYEGIVTPQQILNEGVITTTTAPASSPTGNYWWQFDGTDSLALNSVPFQMADDHCVILGATPLAGNNFIFSIAGSGTGLPRVSTISVLSNGKPLFEWKDNSGTALGGSGVASIVNNPSVISARKSASKLNGRLNGINIVGPLNDTLGATTLSETRIGMFGVASGAGNFTGSIYPVIAIKGTVSDADLLTLERFVGRLSGVTI